MQHPLWEVPQVCVEVHVTLDRLDLGLCTVPLFWLCAFWARDHQVVLQMKRSAWLPLFVRTVVC
jgi:hypothetical protein